MVGKKIILVSGAIITLSLSMLWYIGYESQKNTSVYFSDTVEKPETRSDNLQLDNAQVARVPANNTSNFTQSVLSVLQSNKQGEISPNELENILGLELRSVIAGIERPEVVLYELSDLKHVEGTKENVRDYVKNLKEVSQSYAYPELTNEYLILIRALTQEKTQTEKQKSKNELQKASATYKKMAEEIVKLSVPSGFANRHLETANSFVLLSVGTKYLANAISDPFLAPTGISIYEEALSILEQLP